MLLSRRRFLQVSAGALGLSAAGPLTLSVPAGDGPYPWGLDVSKWQGVINWQAVANAGVAFCFMKATEGTGFVDSQFARNWPSAAQRRIYRGAYHFARPTASPSVTQSAINNANHHLNVARPGQYDLRSVLDIEVSGGLSPANLRTWIQAFVTRVNQRTGRTPIIYTSPGFWRYTVGNPGTNYGCPLWIAHWRLGQWPDVPPAWNRWDFWQYSSSGACPGVSGRVDVNLFNGNYSGLWRFGY